MRKKRLLCVKSVAKQVHSRTDSKDIITKAHQFKQQYGNPHTGIPKAEDFDWYVLGRIDQLYEKQDENFKLILSKLETFHRDMRVDLSKKITKSTFWKVTSILTTLVGVVIVIVVSNA